MQGLLVRLSASTALAVFGGYMLALWFGVVPPDLASPFFVLSMVLILSASFAALVGYVVWLALWEREPNPWPRVTAAVRRFLSPAYFGQRLAPLTLTFIFVGAFGTFKVFIPRIHPFALDGFLSDLDRLVLGTDAWQLSHAVIGPAGTRFIDFCYGLWFPVWGLAIVFFSLFAREELQRRFFLSFFAIWGILGIGLATLLSSAGPCFLDLIGHPYADRYLVPLDNAPNAMRAQKMLADAYLGGGIGVAKGISAMPSVHVAVAALLVLAARHYGRIALVSALIFYVITFVGSVHLGWHYVSDGVVGSIAVLGIWVVTRPQAVLLADAANPADQLTDSASYS